MNAVRAREIPASWRQIEPPEHPTAIGRILRPVGLRGDLKVRLDMDAASRVEERGSLTVQMDDGCWEFEINRQMPSNGFVRFTLAGVNTVEEAELLRGGEIIEEISDPALQGADSYRAEDIIGCDAIADSGQDLGKVTAILPQGHHDLWVVDGGKYGEILVPAVRDFVLSVEIAARRIVIRHVAGLWGSGDEN